MQIYEFEFLTSIIFPTRILSIKSTHITNPYTHTHNLRKHEFQPNYCIKLMHLQIFFFIKSWLALVLHRCWQCKSAPSLLLIFMYHSLSTIALNRPKYIERLWIDINRTAFIQNKRFMFTYIWFYIRHIVFDHDWAFLCLNNTVGGNSK